MVTYPSGETRKLAAGRALHHKAVIEEFARPIPNNALLFS